MKSNNTSKVKHIADYLNGYAFSPADWGDEGYPIIRIQNLTDSAAPLNRTNSEVGERYKILPGDILISWSASLGAHIWQGEVGYLNQHIFKATPRPGVLKAYFIWVAHWFISELQERAHGSTMQHLTRDTFGSFPVRLPDVEEQQRIANFLDDKTAKIDALIAEKERLVKSLELGTVEMMHAAVTKGVRQGTLADSRREWIGLMPAHWTAPYIRFVARMESGHTPSRQHPEYWVNCTIPWFSLADVWQVRDGRKEAVTETAEMVSELGIANSSARLLPKGTVMLSRTASVGFSAVMGVPMATTQDFVNWVCGPKVLPEYLLYVLRSMKTEFDRLKFGSTHSTIYMPDIAALAMPLPPLSEQEEIVAYVRKRKAEMDELSELARVSADRLREYRSSLISAAVTGQLDLSTMS